MILPAARTGSQRNRPANSGGIENEAYLVRIQQPLPIGRRHVHKLGIAAVAALALATSFITGEGRTMDTPPDRRSETAVLGAGCFWCVEAIFLRIDGVISVLPGYAGGRVTNPTYKQVCTGETGHAEVARIEFDPTRVSYAQILDTFWRSHDPTTLNRQGADSGTQYRSAIFCADDIQKRTAEASRAAAQTALDKPIVTEIVPLTKFYPAEDYHRQYYERNKNAGYCQFVIAPKLKKLGLADKAPVAGGN